MKHQIILAASAAILVGTGCANNKATKATGPDFKPDFNVVYGYRYDHNYDYEYDAEYIPELGEWIDYSHDPLSYHYHGRSREVTPQERELYHAEVLALVDPDNDDLANRLAALRQEYKPLLEQLAREDQARFNANIKQMIAEKKDTKKSGETAGK